MDNNHKPNIIVVMRRFSFVLAAIVFAVFIPSLIEDNFNHLTTPILCSAAAFVVGRMAIWAVKGFYGNDSFPKKIWKMSSLRKIGYTTSAVIALPIGLWIANACDIEEPKTYSTTEYSAHISTESGSYYGEPINIPGFGKSYFYYADKASLRLKNKVITNFLKHRATEPLDPKEEPKWSTGKLRYADNESLTAMMRERYERSQQRFAASVTQSVSVNPEEEAQKKRVAKLLNIPPAAVDAMPEFADTLGIQKKKEAPQPAYERCFEYRISNGNVEQRSSNDQWVIRPGWYLLPTSQPQVVTFYLNQVTDYGMAALYIALIFAVGIVAIQLIIFISARLRIIRTE